MVQVQVELVSSKQSLNFKENDIFSLGNYQNAENKMNFQSNLKPSPQCMFPFHVEKGNIPWRWNRTETRPEFKGTIR